MFINSTFGYMSFSQALDEIVSVRWAIKPHTKYLFRNLLYFVAAIQCLIPYSYFFAVTVQNNNPSEWNHKVFDAMTKDFSWDAECCDIYHSAYTSIKSLWTKYKVGRRNVDIDKICIHLCSLCATGGLSWSLIPDFQSTMFRF